MLWKVYFISVQVIHLRYPMNLPAILWQLMTADDLLLTATVRMTLLSMQIRSLSLQKTKCMFKIMLINKAYDPRMLTLDSSTQKSAYNIWQQMSKICKYRTWRSLLPYHKNVTLRYLLFTPQRKNRTLDDLHWQLVLPQGW